MAALFELEPSSSRMIFPEVLPRGVSDPKCLSPPSMYTGSDICSPHPIRHLETPFTYGQNMGIKSIRRRTPDSFETEIQPSRFVGIYPISRSQSRDSPPSSCSVDRFSTPCKNMQAKCDHSESNSVSCSKASSGYEKPSVQVTVPGKNIIDLDRVARGLDTRTTVCLKDHLVQTELKLSHRSCSATSRTRSTSRPLKSILMKPVEDCTTSSTCALV